MYPISIYIVLVAAVSVMT